MSTQSKTGSQSESDYAMSDASENTQIHHAQVHHVPSDSTTPTQSPKTGHKKRKQTMGHASDATRTYILTLEAKIAVMEKELALHKSTYGFQSNVPVSNAFSSLATDDMRMDNVQAQASDHIASANITAQKQSFTKTASTPHKQNAQQQQPAQTTQQQQPVPSATKTRKPPPIVVNDLDCKKLAETLTPIIGSAAFVFRRINKTVTHVITKTLNDFKATRTALQNSVTKHHTFTPKEEQLINIVLRHVDSTYDAVDVQSSITDLQLDIKISKIMKLPTMHNNLWLIQLEPGSDAKQLLQQKYLLNQTVVFEYKKKNGVAQCKNCQQFGHSARNCSHSYRCVKCKEEHEPKMCPRTLTPTLAVNTPPSCVNCKANDHPANFRGCPVYAAIIQRKQQQTTTIHPSQQRQPTMMRVPHVSYADITQAGNSQSKTTPRIANAFDLFETECQNNFNMDMAELHARAKEFYPSFVALPSSKRGMALINFVLTLSK